MSFKIQNSFKEKPLKALEDLLQLIVMPLIAAYLTSTGMFWLYAALLGYCSSLLVTLPFALIAGIKMHIKVSKQPD